VPPAERAPGPIDLRQYHSEAAYQGIQTFLKLPLCLSPEDLRAGEVDVAICGVPFEMVTSRGGTALGPRAVRSADYLGSRSRPHLGVRVDPMEVLTVVDYGDAPVTPYDLDASHAAIRQYIGGVVGAGAIPIIVGGDHSIAWPNVAAMADAYGPSNVGVVHFDAHADASPDTYGALAGHGSPMRRLIVDGHIPGKNFVQVGLRGYTPGPDVLGWMNEQGMKTHFMAEIERDGFEVVMERAINDALDGPEHLYISLDVDVLDPSVAPGTGSPEPGGLTSRELLPMVRRLAHEVGICGMDIVEVSPPFDVGAGPITALFATRAILEALTGIAMRKLGLPGPRYYDPRAVGDAE
jgi:agmatinase